ncbi:hypothetical protein lse_0287 [Listeria seeligeri serovar 1/2b str. SLCC3954]|nr:hypothetical protein lse_0287 [Listeria seeligeri serovar 1/2b str. SLCC3954]
MYSYETESEKANVQKNLEALKAKDNINIIKSEQKGDEYRTELKDEEDNFVISFEIQSGKLIFKKLDKKENVLIKQTYTKQ